MAATTIGIIYTGGTIGAAGEPLAPLPAAEFESAFRAVLAPILLARYPGVAFDFPAFAPSLDSTNLQPADWVRMARLVVDSYEQCDGFVVLHGTDTMAYSAAALSFLLTGLGPDGFADAVLSKPVVLTGSQVPLFAVRHGEAPSLRFDTDAFQNVCGAVSAVFTGVPEVCLFFRNALYRGNRTVKTSASEFDAFSSPNYPPLGEAGIEFALDSDATLPLPVTERVSLDAPAARAVLAGQLDHVAGRVDEVTVVPFLAYPAPSAAAAAVLSGALGAGVDGLVLESYGEGNFPSGDPDDASRGAVYQALRAAHDAGVVVVDNTQVLAGVVNATAYAAGSWLTEVGAVGAHDMTPIASVAKLVYLLALRDRHGWDQATVERLVQTNLAGEIMDVDRLDSRGEWYLAPGRRITALDGSATLTNDFARGPVLAGRDGITLWAPLGDPAGELPGRLYLQGDGDLVFHDASNTPLWSSGTARPGPAGTMLILARGPRLTIYDYANRAEVAVLYG